ncbi:hypothetical protein EVAR_97475_1 [Eumeta japonica]|uniref:Uncharacterized protein n=1 Tax=Eumeta variegata TaxID=151549 RepID=A0A4C2A9H7_EUMVA|nr:hypothetical protein EVAR_97475_1 [Eumeta japonica]
MPNLQVHLLPLNCDNGVTIIARAADAARIAALQLLANWSFERVVRSSTELTFDSCNSPSASVGRSILYAALKCAVILVEHRRVRDVICVTKGLREDAVVSNVQRVGVRAERTANENPNFIRVGNYRVKSREPLAVKYWSVANVIVGTYCGAGTKTRPSRELSVRPSVSDTFSQNYVN